MWKFTCLSLWFLSPYCDSFDVSDSWFLRAVLLSSIMHNTSLPLLTMPSEEFSPLCINFDFYILKRIHPKQKVYKFFFSTSTSWVLFLSFYINFKVILQEIIFSIRKRDSFDKRGSSKDSKSRNVGNNWNSCSYLPFDSDCICLLGGIFFNLPYVFVFFFLILCSTTHHAVKLLLRIYQGVILIHLDWDIGQSTHVGSEILNPC